jgi:hypothetical protein
MLLAGTLVQPRPFLIAPFLLGCSLSQLGLFVGCLLGRLGLLLRFFLGCLRLGRFLLFILHTLPLCFLCLPLLFFAHVLGVALALLLLAHKPL